MSYLKLRFVNDDDDTGELLAQAAANGFAGEGEAWFSVDQIKRFAKAIAAFPLSDDPCCSLAGGFFEKDGSGRLAQEHLYISVYPINHRGNIGVQVQLADAMWQDFRQESQRRVQLEITTTYEPLGRFSRQVQALARGDVEEAVLEGEEP